MGLGQGSAPYKQRGSEPHTQQAGDTQDNGGSEVHAADKGQGGGLLEGEAAVRRRCMQGGYGVPAKGRGSAPCAACAPKDTHPPSALFPCFCVAQVFYYRKPVWARLHAAAMQDLTATRFKAGLGRGVGVGVGGGGVGELPGGFGSQAMHVSWADAMDEEEGECSASGRPFHIDARCACLPACPRAATVHACAGHQSPGGSAGAAGEASYRACIVKPRG